MDISALKNPYYGNDISTNFFPCAVEISFLHTKVCRNAPFIYMFFYIAYKYHILLRIKGMPFKNDYKL